jgi:hypothetical protein
MTGIIKNSYQMVSKKPGNNGVCPFLFADRLPVTFTIDSESEGLLIAGESPSGFLHPFNE